MKRARWLWLNLVVERKRSHGLVDDRVQEAMEEDVIEWRFQQVRKGIDLRC